MKKLFLILFSLIILLSDIKSQDFDDPFDYGTEFLWAITTNTRSGIIAGGMFRYAAKINDNTYRTFGIEVANIRHPLENRIRNPFNGSFITYGKQNYLISIRPQYGYDRTIFRKSDQKGVQVNGSIAGGPSFGWLIPYFVDVFGPDRRIISVPYDPFDPLLMSPGNIVSGSGPFRGMGSSSMRIGANIRASLLFEFGTFKSNITGFEVGFMLEGFAGDVTIMPLVQGNNNLLPSAFLSIIFGSRR